jgi:hypothetical protein
MQTTLERTDFETLVKRAEALLREAGAREVYVFGPAVDNGSREIRDVRYAVRGLPPELYFDVMAKIADVTDDYPVIQNLETEDSFVQFLEERGRLRPVDDLL